MKNLLSIREFTNPVKSAIGNLGLGQIIRGEKIKEIFSYSAKIGSKIVATHVDFTRGTFIKHPKVGVPVLLLRKSENAIKQVTGSLKYLDIEIEEEE